MYPFAFVSSISALDTLPCGSLRELKRKYSWNVIVADFEKKLLSILSNKNGNN